MATLLFAYDHSRDPMNPDDLADKLAAQFNVTTSPTVDIDPTSITVTHPQLTDTQQNRTTIQGIIDAYTLDTNRVALPPGVIGTLLNKARTAITTNNTFLALGSPTNAQTLAQVQALSRENTAVIKLLLATLAGLAQDTSGT